jgi:hypothetical protein
MIVEKNTNPKYDLYFLGAKIIEFFLAKNAREYDYFALYKEFLPNEKIGIKLYSLALDWLFLLNAIQVGPNGTVKRCF